MVTKEDLIEALNKWAAKMDNPDVAAQFEDYNKTMQFCFPDIEVNLQLKFDNKIATVVEDFDDNADMNLTVDSELFMGIADGSVDPMEAFTEGKLKPKGDMTDLEKLQVFMED
jgi:putative sterol carrier protein